MLTRVWVTIIQVFAVFAYESRSTITLVIIFSLHAFSIILAGAWFASVLFFTVVTHVSRFALALVIVFYFLASSSIFAWA